MEFMLGWPILRLVPVLLLIKGIAKLTWTGSTGRQPQGRHAPISIEVWLLPRSLDPSLLSSVVQLLLSGE